MEIKAVIWDLDGTLLNTLDDLAASTNEALARSGLPVHAKADIARFVGHGMRRLIMRAVPDGEENPKFETVYQTFLSHYAAHSSDLTRPYEGILDVLDALSARGVRHAIASNKMESAVQELSSKYFGTRMQAAIGDAPGRSRKPAPDCVLEAMRVMDAGAQETVYVGDSEVDVQTARNAGIPCVSVTWGFRPESLIREAGAEHIAHTPQELLEMIEAL